MLTLRPRGSPADGIKHDSGEDCIPMNFCSPCYLQQEHLEIQHRMAQAAAAATSGAAK